MNAIVMSAEGGPEVMKWSEVADAERPRGDEVLIEIAATALNRADVAQRQGRYPLPPGVSDVLGLECSGVISAVGDDVSDLGVGQRVSALLTGGGYAERVTVRAGTVMPVDDDLSLLEAAALPESLCTVYSNLVMDGAMKAGETVLVHGGGSSVGTIAIQLVRALGATPLVTVGSQEKRTKCLELGAALAINYREQDFLSDIRDFTDGDGVDIILDCVGGSYLPRNLESLAVDGRLLIISVQGGLDSQVSLAQIMRRRLTMHGSTLRGRSHQSQSKILAEVDANVMPLVAKGAILPIMHEVLPIQEVAVAHRIMENGDNFGKIVLAVNPEMDEPGTVRAGD
jgi:putative PIG3 family NAD(P)H quinone oxidoreductase